MKDSGAQPGPSGFHAAASPLAALLGVSWGAYYFCLLVLACVHGGISEAEEWGLYALGSLAVPPLTLCTTAKLLRGARKAGEALAPAYGTALWIHLSLWAAALCILKARMGGAGIPVLVLLAAALPLANACVFRCRSLRAIRGASPAGLLAAAPVFLFGISFFFFPISLGPGQLAAAAAGAAGLSGWMLRKRAAAREPSGASAILPDLLVVAGIALVVFNAALEHDPFHYNFYLGPVADVLAGKSMLIEASSQYGVLSILALSVLVAAGPVPLHHAGFSALFSTLLVLHYGLVYFIARRSLRHQGIAAAAAAAVVLMSFYAFPGGVINYPSSGPIRFGLPYLLLGAACLRPHLPRLAPLLPRCEAALVGIAAVWSVETFFYTAAAYAGLRAYEATSLLPDSRAFIRRLLSDAAAALAASLAAVIAVSVGLFAAAGRPPDWDRYLDYVAAYGPLTALNAESWTPWPLLPAIYIGSVVLLFAGSLRRPDGLIPAGLAALGLAQFSYFVGRSDLAHLYFVCTPAVLLVFYWLDRLLRRDSAVPAGFRAAAAVCCAAALSLLFVINLPAQAGRFYNSALVYVLEEAVSTIDPGLKQELARGRLPRQSRWEAQAAELEQLLARHAPSETRSLAFAHPDILTGAFIRLRRTHVFPISYVDYDVHFHRRIIIRTQSEAVRYPHGLAPGAVLFLERQVDLPRIQKAILERLRREFGFREIARTRHFQVFRLAERESPDQATDGNERNERDEAGHPRP